MITLLNLVRSLAFYAGYAIIMILQPTASLLAKPFVSKAFLHRFTTNACVYSVWWAKVVCGIRYEVIGKENIPDVPCVILSKHQSAWETLFLQVLFQPTSTVLKKELLRIPFFGWGLALMEPIAIDRSQRSNALKDVIRQGVERLAAGNNVIIFPEGTRTMPGEQTEYSAGGAMLAVKAKVPALPVALNSGLFWPRGSLIKRPGTIRIVIGKPIDATQKSAKQINQESRDWIEANCRT